MNRILTPILDDNLQKIFDHFSSILDIRILFYSPTGEIIKVGLNRPNSNYCSLIQKELKGRQRCLELDDEKRNEAAAAKKTICYTCHAGLKESITPIYSDNILLGFIGFGQFRTEEQIPAGIKETWKTREDSEQLEAEYMSLPLFPPEKLDHILGLFSIIINHIVTHRLVTMKGDLLIFKIISWLKENIHLPLSLTETAEKFDRSESTISHLFNRKTGMSFKKNLILMKLEKAEEYLERYPDIKISEVAVKTGYEDPLYFSRLFRKYRGISPREYQNQHKRSPENK